MNREEAIARVGLAAVEAVESENCEPTGRQFPYPVDYQEWAAQVNAISIITGVDVVLSAIYYPLNADFLRSAHFPNADPGELLDDLSNIDWIIDHYQIDGQA